ncbi:MAG: hypothetical protein AB1806_17870 [Acidobacteriota bacterium]
MADLLECLLQIKGLAESLNRLSALAAQSAGRGGAAVAAVTQTAAGLASAEHGWHQAFSSALPNRGFADDSPAWPACGTEDPVVAFNRARRATLEFLDLCSAADLSASATLGGLGRVTVADIVAHMLANDTERLGALRNDLSLFDAAPDGRLRQARFLDDGRRTTHDRPIGY